MCKLKGNGGLGFRSFRKFNIVLPTKQEWHLVKNPDSLITKVLKAKYFLQIDFLNATLKSGSSYTWKSILAMSKVLKDGLGWRVGKRDKISIVNHVWVPGSVDYKLASPIIDSNLELVSELIDPESRKCRTYSSNSFGYDPSRRLIDLEIRGHW